MDSITYGKKCEIIACNFLKKKGYEVLQTNYKNKIGEIDIICRDKEYIVFVEVKGRHSRLFGDPLEAVNLQKQFKIRQVATGYLLKEKKMNSSVRFDVISVLGDEDYEIRHIINAF